MSPDRLLPLFLLGCGPPADRVIVLGMDGLERSMVERLVAQGELPHFQRLAEEGSVNDMAVSWPVLSPIIWTSIASGYPGEVHGIGGWTTAAGRPYTAADVRVLRIWDAAAAEALPTLTLGWLMSWPASPVPGAMLTDRFVWSFPMNKDPEDPTVAISRADHEDSYGLSWPPDLDARAFLAEAGELRDSPVGWQLDEYAGPFHPAMRDETQVRAFEALWSATEARVGLVYLAGADQVSPLYWPFTDEDFGRRLRQDPRGRMEAAAEDRARHPGRRAHPFSEAPITPEQLREGARWVPAYYRYLDQLLGRVMAVIDPAHTTLVVCSDHGFQVAQANPLLNGGHRPVAVLMAWGGGARARVPPPRPACWTSDPRSTRWRACRRQRTCPGGSSRTSSTWSRGRPWRAGCCPAWPSSREPAPHLARRACSNNSRRSGTWTNWARPCWARAASRVRSYRLLVLDHRPRKNAQKARKQETSKT